jgi:hypothetical protein
MQHRAPLAGVSSGGLPQILWSPLETNLPSLAGPIFAMIILAGATPGCGDFDLNARLAEACLRAAADTGVTRVLPLRYHIERFPDLYGAVLKSRPGITGLASIACHVHEELLLARGKSTTQTDAIHTRTCVQQKARLVLICQKRRTLCSDMLIMLKTVIRRVKIRHARHR